MLWVVREWVTRWRVWWFGVPGIMLLAVWWQAGERPRVPLSHSAYVWQRAWTEPVTNAVQTYGARFASLVVLAAEVSWTRQELHLVRPDFDYPALSAAKTPIGLALRIGSYPGPFAPEAPGTRWLAELARQLVAAAQTNGIKVAELQLDFDCAESKLGGYREWLEAIRKQVTPVPLTITALPSWLNRPEFSKVLAAVDGWVLQVHSLERPHDAYQRFILCNPDAARRAVNRAARYGKPFQVALPTYGYHIAFDTEGRFVGISSEGPAWSWPATACVREVRTDPGVMADLVAGWQRERPQQMQGIIWYRLPVGGDQLNWPWPTLAAVMQGQKPSGQLELAARLVPPALIEICATNLSQAEAVLPRKVRLCWTAGRFIAADGLQGFTVAEADYRSFALQRDQGGPAIGPGQGAVIGWARFEQNPEVQLEVLAQGQ